MSKLRLGALSDDKPVKVSLELHRDLIAYAAALTRESGEVISDPTKLISPMLARFMATDRAFSKVRRKSQTGVAE